jgi:hypothetical protein
MKKLVVADIDGCCISVERRLHHWLNGDVEAFSDQWHTDTPIAQGVAVYQQFLDSADYHVLFVTARWERWRAHTLHTLQRHVCADIVSDQLLMRPNHMRAEFGSMPGDFKPWLLEAHGYRMSDVFIAFDDSQSVIAGWRQRGVTAYLTAGDHK